MLHQSMRTPVRFARGYASGPSRQDSTNSWWEVMGLSDKNALAYQARSFLNPGRFVEIIDTAGDSPSVFLFRPLLNGLGGYTNLIARIRSTTNLFALRFPDALSFYAPDVFVNVGRLYAAAIASSGITSPIHLLGWSFGGLFAYECARHLRLLGVSVDSVILVEAAPFADAQIPEDPETRRDFFWTTFFENKLFKEDQDRISRELNFLSLSDRRKLGIIRSNELSFPGPFVERIDIRKEFRFVTDMLVAQCNYRPEGYEGRCYIISGDENRTYIEDSWSRMNVADLRMVKAKGRHVELMLHFAVEPVFDIIHQRHCS